MVNAEPVPHLFVVTRPVPIEQLSELLDYADPHEPLVWTRGDRGCVGVGELLRLEFSGEDRFNAATSVWRRISAAATLDNPVGLPGTGLIAFGTFAFDDRSTATSLLLVPRYVISRHDGVAWLTEVSREPISSCPQLPAPRVMSDWKGSTLDTSAPDDLPRWGQGRNRTH